MTDLNNLSGTFTLDPSHSEIGFAARHAMVTKVRGSFNEFEGIASTGANLADAKIDVTIQTASVSTGSADRDGHLQSGDFFDVEAYPTIRFTSTSIAAVGTDALHVEGDLTIKDVTRPIAIDFDFEGVAVDPFGNERVGLSGEVVVNRKDFGLEWNAALETGGVLVSEKVTLGFEVSAIKSVETADEAVVPASDEVQAEDAPAVEETTDDEPVAKRAITDEPAKAGFVGWIKKIFQPANR
jgi:polyisoprenoid-binding protein YceI